MKLLTRDLLAEHGFTYDAERSDLHGDVMVHDGFIIFIKNDGTFYYSNTGIDYPLRDLAGLKKLFKEVKSRDLKPL